jgi:hypothetical protein
MGVLRKLLDHPWTVGIVGGALATIIGTYAVAALFGSSPQNPVQSVHGPKREINLDVQPQPPSAAGQCTIAIFVGGATPHGAIEIDVYDPGGSTYNGISVGADEAASIFTR